MVTQLFNCVKVVCPRQESQRCPLSRELRAVKMSLTSFEKLLACSCYTTSVATYFRPAMSTLGYVVANHSTGTIADFTACPVQNGAEKSHQTSSMQPTPGRVHLKANLQVCRHPMNNVQSALAATAAPAGC